MSFLMCTAIFLILWPCAKADCYTRHVVRHFCILIGIQRYSIEQWRDLSGRDTYKVLGMAFRQSELISISLFAIGVACCGVSLQEG